MKTILEEIINKKKLTKTELKIANFFLENKNSLFFFTALEIGEKLGISDTSVIRFVKSLGFKSFTEFKDFEISSVSSKILTPSEKLSLNQSALKKDDILNYFLEEVNIGLKECLNDESLKKIQLIADILKNAEKKYIISFKTAGEITDFFGLRLGFILDNVSTYKEADLKLATSIIDLTEKDVLFLVIYPKYFNTYNHLIEYAQKVGAKIIIITDKTSSPFANSGDVALLTHTKGISFFHSMIITQAILEFIISYISKNITEKEKTRLNTITDIIFKNID